MIPFEPVGDRLMIAPKKSEDSQETMTKTGIIVFKTEAKDETPDCGTIVALGEGGTFPDCPDPRKFFHVGQVVYFNKYAGDDLEVDGQPYKMIRVDAILGKVPTPKAHAKSKK